MKRLPITLCLTLAAGLPVATMGARPVRAAEEAGARVTRFKGVVKAVDARTGRFVVPVSRGRDGEPAAPMVDVLIHTTPGTRLLTPGAEGRGAAPVRFNELTPGKTVSIRGAIQRDGSVLAQEVTVHGGAGAAEGEGRPSPEAGLRDGQGGENRGPRDGEGGKVGPREGDGGVKRGPRDGEGNFKRGPRDGEGPAKVGPREGEGPGRIGGEEANVNGFIPGRVKALDARRNAFLFQYREGERGNLRNMEAVIFVTPTTRVLHGRPTREGAEAGAATFRDIVVGAIVHVQASRGPDGFYASEVRVMPLAKRNRGPVQREGGAGRAPAEGEGRRSPEGDRKP